MATPLEQCGSRRAMRFRNAVSLGNVLLAVGFCCFAPYAPSPRGMLVCIAVSCIGGDFPNALAAVFYWASNRAGTTRHRHSPASRAAAGIATEKRHRAPRRRQEQPSVAGKRRVSFIETTPPARSPTKGRHSSRSLISRTVTPNTPRKSPGRFHL